MWEVDHNSEHWRTDALELWCWRRLLSVPWTARTSNQSILKEINTEYSLEGLVLELKPQYFGHLMQRADSSDKTLMLGKIEGKRRRERQRMRWLDSTTDSTDMNFSGGKGSLACCCPWSPTRKEWAWLSDWSTAKISISSWGCYFQMEKVNGTSIVGASRVLRNPGICVLQTLP